MSSSTNSVLHYCYHCHLNLSHQCQWLMLCYWHLWSASIFSLYALGNFVQYLFAVLCRNHFILQLTSACIKTLDFNILHSFLIPKNISVWYAQYTQCARNTCDVECFLTGWIFDLLSSYINQAITSMGQLPSKMTRIK